MQEVTDDGLTRRKYSRFHLIDLAGSERQKSTQAIGSHIHTYTYTPRICTCIYACLLSLSLCLSLVSRVQSLSPVQLYRVNMHKPKHVHTHTSIHTHALTYTSHITHILIISSINRVSSMCAHTVSPSPPLYVCLFLLSSVHMYTHTVRIRWAVTVSHTLSRV